MILGDGGFCFVFGGNKAKLRWFIKFLNVVTVIFELFVLGLFELVFVDV